MDYDTKLSTFREMVCFLSTCFRTCCFCFFADCLERDVFTYFRRNIIRRLERS